MNLRTGTSADADAVAELIASFRSELTDDPSGSGAEKFFDSVSVVAERSYLESARYRYIVAERDGETLGFIAIRDGSHVFHLFVARKHQRLGVARRLWDQVHQSLGGSVEQPQFTVNSSLRAVPVYRSFGFVETGPIISAHGISFLPMRLSRQSTLV
jgi:GNAT superfamily N-acetyltransferase